VTQLIPAGLLPRRPGQRPGRRETADQ